LFRGSLSLQLKPTSSQNNRAGVPSRPTKTTDNRKVASSKATNTKLPAKANAVKVQAPKPPSNAKLFNKLPGAPPTKGLSFKMPRGKKEADIHSRLKKKSPWYQSIVDPLGGADVKIPDETGVETGTLQVCQRATATVNALNIAGMKISSPYINKKPTGVVSPAEGINFQVISPAVGASTIAWGRLDGVTFVSGGGYPFQGTEEIQQITNSHRIVSAALYVQPEASLSTNQGEITLFQSPFSDETSEIYEDYMNRYKSVIVPVNSNKASVVRWYPIARNDWNFKSFMRTTGTEDTDDDESDACFPNWNLGFVADGCEPGTVFRVMMVVNYEFIPKQNTLNVLGASPSPQDATETDLVENWVQDMPVAQAIPQSAAAKSPAAATLTHENNDEGTGFGMFFNVVKELAPLALALI